MRKSTNDIAKPVLVRGRGKKRRTKLNEINASFYVSCRRALPLATTCSRAASHTMATEVQTAPVLNGINGHGASKSKAKSKNQLRREKLKQKKVALASAPVRCAYFPFDYILLIIFCL